MPRTYIYNGPPDRQPLGPLPAGDYDFIVSSHDELYEKNERFILPVKLKILPSGHTVFARPWSGYTDAGEPRDGVAEFLICCNCAPKIGAEPDWDSIDGARGRVRLRVKLAEKGNLAGKEVNEVDWFLIPKELPAARGEPAKRPVHPRELDDDLDLGEKPEIPF